MLLLLNPYFDVIVAGGLALIAFVLITAIFKSLSGLPAIGPTIESFGNRVAQAIAHKCGDIFSGITHAVGGSLHAIANLMTRTASVIEGEAAGLVHVARVVGDLVYRVSGVRSLAHTLAQEWRGIEHGVRDLVKKLHGIDKLVRRLERDLSHGIGHDLRIGLRDLRKEVKGLERGAISDLETGLNVTEGELTELQRWLGVKVGTTYKDWAIALATTLLASVGLGGLRCPAFTRLLGKYGCGLGNILEGLFGLVLSTLALENVCTLLPILESAFGEVVGPIISLLTEVPLGGCEQPPKAWASLSVAYSTLPPAQSLGTLPG